MTRCANSIILFLVFIIGCEANQSQAHLKKDSISNPQVRIEKPVEEAAKEVTVEKLKEEATDNSKRTSKVIKPFDHISILLDERIIEFEGIVCLDLGWLEQIVCIPGTREHESLIVTLAKPSEIHAALLMTEYEPGRPGRWIYEDDKISIIPPEGDKIEILIRYTVDGKSTTEPIQNWIRDYQGKIEFPGDPWVFGGSLLADNPEYMGPGQHYVADYSGSVIGLVTFGDELLGFPDVVSDQATIQQPEWEADTANLPPVGTEVTIILRPAASQD